MTETPPPIDITQKERVQNINSRLEVSIQSLPSELREAFLIGEGRSAKVRVDGGHQENEVFRSAEQSAYELTETEAASREQTQFSTRPSAYVFKLSLWYGRDFQLHE